MAESRSGGGGGDKGKRNGLPKVSVCVCAQSMY